MSGHMANSSTASISNSSTVSWVHMYIDIFGNCFSIWLYCNVDKLQQVHTRLYSVG